MAGANPEDLADMFSLAAGVHTFLIFRPLFAGKWIARVVAYAATTTSHAGFLSLIRVEPLRPFRLPEPVLEHENSSACCHTHSQCHTNCESQYWNQHGESSHVRVSREDAPADDGKKVVGASSRSCHRER